MNETIYYIGLILSIIFFIASVVLFIIKKIPTVIGYLLKIGKIKIGGKNAESSATLSIEAMNARLKTQTGEQTNLLFDGDEGTLSDAEQTNLLSTVQNYATALLDADSTSILPEINFQD